MLHDLIEGERRSLWLREFERCRSSGMDADRAGKSADAMLAEYDKRFATEPAR